MKKKWIGIQCNKCRHRLTNLGIHSCYCGSVTLNKTVPVNIVPENEEDYTDLYDYDNAPDLIDINSML